MGRKGQHPLANRIKRLMQTDEDVGKIAGPTPALIGRAMELFLQQLCEGSASVAMERHSKILTASHMKEYVVGTSQMDFLKDKFSDVPDLGESSGAADKKAAARPSKRAKVGLSEAGVAAGSQACAATKGAEPEPPADEPKGAAALAHGSRDAAVELAPSTSAPVSSSVPVMASSAAGADDARAGSGQRSGHVGLRGKGQLAGLLQRKPCGVAAAPGLESGPGRGGATGAEGDEGRQAGVGGGAVASGPVAINPEDDDYDV